MTEKLCPCGSGKLFFNCCEPIILMQKNASTAEELMRSRYSAYATRAVDYIFESTHPKTKKHYTKKDISDWAKNSDWQKLEILSSTENEVVFKAYYTDLKGKLQVHEEHSLFVKEGERWFFVEAI